MLVFHDNTDTINTQNRKKKKKRLYEGTCSGVERKETRYKETKKMSKKGQTNFSSVQHNPLEEKYHWKSNI